MSIRTTDLWANIGSTHMVENSVTGSAVLVKVDTVAATVVVTGEVKDAVEDTVFVVVTVEMRRTDEQKGEAEGSRRKRLTTRSTARQAAVLPDRSSSGAALARLNKATKTVLVSFIVGIVFESSDALQGVVE